MPNSPTCAACGHPIREPYYVYAGENSYHQSCLTLISPASQKDFQIQQLEEENRRLKAQIEELKADIQRLHIADHDW